MELEDTSHLSIKAQYDYNLVNLAKKGDQKAYAELMDRYRDSIYFLLLKMVNNRDDANDLTVEAFGKAFNNLHQYTPTFAFSTWLFKIASNNCIDFIRRKKKKFLSIDKRYEDEEGIETGIDLHSQMLDPEEKFLKKQKVKTIRDIVKTLKPRYRMLVELRYFKEMTYEEIAKKLDIPIGTVKAQLYRAREFLFSILKNIEGKL